MWHCGTFLHLLQCRILQFRFRRTQTRTTSIEANLYSYTMAGGQIRRPRPTAQHAEWTKNTSMICTNHEN